MPRIPVRTEPYTSPSRQHRHFKNKRDQVLRALGKAAYINGSHFAIMWVSARGEVETYASDALQSRLDDWFIKRGISEEAKELVRASRPSGDAPQSAAAMAFPGLDIDDDEDVDDEDDEDLDGDKGMDRIPSSTPNLTLNNNEDVFIDSDRTSSLKKQQALLDARPSPQGKEEDLHGLAIASRTRRAMAPLDINVARQHLRRDLSNSSSPSAAGSGGLRLPIDNVENNVGIMPHSAPLRGKSSMLVRSVSTGNLPISSSASLANAGLTETTFHNEAARTAFLELRFGQLQQGMCKTVSKAWIKIIEPKKQTRCPYNRGEEGKPDWWPQGVRHKEPDHLMKPERHALLLTILRSPKVKIARLQLATAEVVALMKADKVSLLMDVYRVAREEETSRIAGGNVNASMTVAVSTLEGWSESEQCAIVSPERPGSPTMEDDTMLSRSSKKRAAASTPLGRSASSSSALRANKRLAHSPIGLGLHVASANGNPAMLDMPTAISRRAPSQTGSSTWLMHEPSRHGIKRTSVSSHPNQSGQERPSPMVGSSPSTIATPQHQHMMQSPYAIVHASAGHAAQMMDPAFLAHHEQFGGYMSMPHSQPQPLPHGPAMFQGPPARPHQLQSGIEDFAAYQQQMGTNIHNAGQANGNALGLHSVEMPWGLPQGFQEFGQPDNGSAVPQNWWDSATTDSRMHNSVAGQHSGLASHQPHAASTVPGMGEGSFDNSFASTIESAGPATPPGSSSSQRHLGASSSLSKAGLFPSVGGGNNAAREAKTPISNSLAHQQANLGGPLTLLDAQNWIYPHASSQ